LSTGLQPETGWSVLDYELREQKAHTLGTLSGQVERALAALRIFDAEAHEPGWEDRRRALLDDAADLVWAFMIRAGAMRPPELGSCGEGRQHSP
jgi:hypothetical protein